ncbi:NUDIX domain-containing protein [Pararhodobacter marinus]|uniref:NUDIX domain-containing protein n=1 Tax=Pararhodobacter marinus TaxID=2184063 RepID=UPI00351414D5
MPAKPLFLFGTLRHAPLLDAVAGAPLDGEAATLADHAVSRAVDGAGIAQRFPLCAAQPGAVAPGLLVRPDARAMARLDAYEQLWHYRPEPVTVQATDGPVEALVYRPEAGLFTPGEPWSLAEWVALEGRLRTEVAQALMPLFDRLPPAIIAERYPLLAGHVASRLRAADEPAPATLRHDAMPDDVALLAREEPYTRFFAVIEDRLRHRRFGGGSSETVLRAAFLMSDAVTVLPYDPVRDRVMVVEQFRAGPFARGDRNPWSIEAIAGRIDAGEEPETAARREAREEAALDLGVLHSSGRYYPSPGAVTEYLYTYIGLAGLPDEAAGIHGLASEAEDIRSHVLPFERLMDLIRSGEVANGPLITSAYWLALNRERLRQP